MKRLHVHIAVEDLARSLDFYRRLFAAEPTVLKPDYAKWMLEDPRVNFAISARGAPPAIEHLGIQAEDPGELQDIYRRLREAAAPVREEGNTTCCYARSEKSWTADPQGVAWEVFLTRGESTVYGGDPDLLALAAEDACCTAETPQGVCCEPKTGLSPEAPCCATQAAAG